MQSYALFILNLIMATRNAQVIDMSTTFYSKQLLSAPIDASAALYFKIALCPQGISDSKQAMLHIAAPMDPEWDTVNHPFIVVQVSKCKGSFTAACVFAQNYVWGPKVTAVSSISWEIDNVTDIYYIRAMAGYETSSFSMELSFTNDINTTHAFPGTEGKPFGGTEISYEANLLDQYWISRNLFTVENNKVKKFSFAYCDQGENIQGINIALSTLTYNLSDYSLVQQWACTTATKVEDCTYSNYDWHDQHIASFNDLPCDNQQASTANGIIVGVSGNGANIDKNNTFIISASCIY